MATATSMKKFHSSQYIHQVLTRTPKNMIYSPNQHHFMSLRLLKLLQREKEKEKVKGKEKMSENDYLFQ